MVIQVSDKERNQILRNSEINFRIMIYMCAGDFGCLGKGSQPLRQLNKPQ